jgi:hypothetical protein
MADEGNESERSTRDRSDQQQEAPDKFNTSATATSIDASGDKREQGADSRVLEDLDSRVLGAVRQAVADVMKDGKKPADLPAIDMGFAAPTAAVGVRDDVGESDPSQRPPPKSEPNRQTDSVATLPQPKAGRSMVFAGVCAGFGVAVAIVFVALNSGVTSSVEPVRASASSRSAFGGSDLAKLALKQVSAEAKLATGVVPQRPEAMPETMPSRRADAMVSQAAEAAERKRLAEQRAAEEKAHRAAAEKQRQAAQASERKRVAEQRAAEEEAHRAAVEKQRQVVAKQRQRLASLQREAGASKAREIEDLAATSKERLQVESQLVDRLFSVLKDRSKARNEANNSRLEPDLSAKSLRDDWAVEEKVRLRLQDSLIEEKKALRINKVPRPRRAVRPGRKMITLRLKESNLEIIGELRSYVDMQYVVILPSNKKVSLPAEHFNCFGINCPVSDN